MHISTLPVLFCFVLFVGIFSPQRSDVIPTCQLEAAATAAWPEELAEPAIHVNTSF